MTEANLTDLITVHKGLKLIGTLVLIACSVCPALASKNRQQDSQSPVLTNADVLNLAKAGLGDAVIIDKIRASNCRFDTSADALVTLKSDGVSSAVLAAMIEKGNQAAPCVILKRMGPADQVTSHLYSFGLRGKQFQYVEGQLPNGVKFHGRLTDHDVRTIQSHGGRIAILNAHYTEQELGTARKSCTGSATLPAKN
jgi:hypothetical protein